jgi:hypothetical protein
MAHVLKQVHRLQALTLGRAMKSGSLGRAAWSTAKISVLRT